MRLLDASANRFARPIVPAAASAAAWSAFEGIGQSLGDADVQIAATALRYDLELVTGNLRHFRRIAGLRIATILDSARRGEA